MNSKVLIVIPPLISIDKKRDPKATTPDFESYRLVSPVEPTSVAADLLARGFEVRIFDFTVREEVPARTVVPTGSITIELYGDDLHESRALSLSSGEVANLMFALSS